MMLYYSWKRELGNDRKFARLEASENDCGRLLQLSWDFEVFDDKIGTLVSCQCPGLLMMKFETSRRYEMTGGMNTEPDSQTKNERSSLLCRREKQTANTKHPTNPF